MFTYQRLNNLAGWLVLIISATVYIVTLEPTASFWDCGEFIAVSNNLMTPHPPGAPLFLLLGRLFSLFASDVTQVAYWINMVSALSSAFTILFLFWTITLIARKVMGVEPGEEPELGKKLAIIGAGLVGSLSYTFTDSFWFSAVEAEVYALSAFFTAFVFWAILKWETVADEKGSDRWLILIAYMVGLSIGVHLLNLVTIPALAFVFYFKKYKPTPKGAGVTFLVSSAILFVILVIIIPGLPSIAGMFEIAFVNGLGMPFNSGSIFFALLLFGGIIFAIYYSQNKGKRMMNTAFLSLMFILVGYSTYAIIIIRSNYNPPIDENNPEDVMTFVSYLKREQYGDRPLFHGPQFTAGRPVDQDKDGLKYKKGEDEYIPYDYNYSFKYDKEHVMLAPRMHSTRADHVARYKDYLKRQGGWRDGRKPSFGQNISFMLNEQIGYYYMRYFFWNFVGREGDDQDLDVLWPTDTQEVPELMQSNARNNYWAIPLIIGIIGFFFQLHNNKKSTLIISMLFFFTGIAIILYLNTPPHEPRERDYAYAGSYYAFSIWIAMGVLAFYKTLSTGKLTIPTTDIEIPLIKMNGMVAAVLAIGICSTTPIILAAENWDDHDRSNRYHSVDSAKNLLDSCAPGAILFTGGDNDTFPLWYVQEVEGYRTDVRVCNLSLLNTYWYIDQMKRPAHNSEGLPISFEKDEYFEGSNDYAQYYNAANQRQPKDKQIPDKVMNVAAYIKQVREDNPSLRFLSDKDINKYQTIFPSKLLKINFDKAATLALDEKKRNTEGDQAMIPTDADLQNRVVQKLEWNVGKGTLEKKHLIMLDMIANIAKDNWDRPIYWSTTVGRSDYLGLDNYMILEGLAYRLTPVKHDKIKTAKDGTPYRGMEIINPDIMYRNMVETYKWREMDNEDVYYNEDYDRMVMNARRQYFGLAAYYMQVEQDSARAKEVIEYANTVLPDKTFPFRIDMIQAIDILFELGETEKALEIARKVIGRGREMTDYLVENKDDLLNEFFVYEPKFDSDLQTARYTAVGVYQVLQKHKQDEELAKHKTWIETNRGNF